MVKNVFYGEPVAATQGFTDINLSQVLVLTILTALIFAVGIYPEPFFRMIHETVGLIVNKYVII
jgi:NADH:ubiquinone oxidoreductase subunit 4 (subunit M)